MAKAYSLPLRERVWRAWQAGEGSQRALARRFHVSASFVRALSRRVRQSGGVAAKAHGGGRPPWADAARRAPVQARVTAQNDATNDEPHARLRVAGYHVSRATAGRLLLRLRRTRKKRRSATTRVQASG